MANSHIPVINHHCKKSRLSDFQRQGAVHLGHSSNAANGLLLANQMDQHVGHCSGDIARIQNECD